MLILALALAALLEPDNSDPSMRALHDAEVARIQTHLDGALALVESADTSGLTREQLERRQEHVARLRAYRDDGVFPMNDDHPGEVVPSFRDRRGTLCAMAFLIEASGRPDLVEKVRQQRNHATVLELAGDPELVAWLLDNGLSLEEAARIQPGYTKPGCVANSVCGVPGAVTLVRWRMKDEPYQVRRKRGARIRLVEKYGDCSVGPELGARQQVSGDQAAGDPLELLDRDGQVLRRMQVGSDDRVQWESCGGPVSSCLTGDTSPPVDLVVQAFLAPDACRAALTAGGLGRVCAEPRAQQAPALPPPQACPAPLLMPLVSCGCTADGPGQPWPLAVLALGAALRRRRQPSTTA